MKPTNPYRSHLFVPAHNMSFIQKSFLRGADFLLFDLEDGVRPEDKGLARENILAAIDFGHRGGGDVFVRVNNEPELLMKDIEASVWPGLNGITIPKVEDIGVLLDIENEISRLESERGVQPGSVSIFAMIESAKGFLHMDEIFAASERCRLATLGVEDFSREIGMKVDKDTDFSIPYFQVIVSAVAHGIQPVGLVRTLTNYKDLEGLKENVRQSVRTGLRGSCVIHPSQIPVVNRGFSPDEEEIDYARRVVDAFENGGGGAVSLDGKMVDKPVADRAKALVNRWQSVHDFEVYKEKCMSENS